MILAFFSISGSVPHLRHDEAEGAAGRVGNKKTNPKKPAHKNPKKTT
jgi:hypothetical protein